MMSKSLSYVKIYHDVKKFVMSPKVCYEVKKFAIISKTHHDTKKFVITSQTRHDVKNTLWCQKVRHDVKITFNEICLLQETYRPIIYKEYCPQIVEQLAFTLLKTHVFIYF